MATYALTKKGIVMNTIVWEGPDLSPMGFGKGVTLADVDDGDGNSPSIGWSYDGLVFTHPPLTGNKKANNHQAARAANIMFKQVLMEEASNKISLLQDVVHLDMVTNEEAKYLHLWKKYRVLINRISKNSPDEIGWQEKP